MGWKAQLSSANSLPKKNILQWPIQAERVKGYTGCPKKFAPILNPDNFVVFFTISL